MAKFNGNIFNRAAGSIGGNTFSQARYRGGKLQTARQRVTPANPNTAAQKEVRRNLADSIFIVNRVKISQAFSIWNNAVGKLPAFQSLTSVLQAVKTVTFNDYQFTKAPIEIPRGITAPQSITGITVSNPDGIYQVDTTTGAGTSNDNDDVIGFAVPSRIITPTQPAPRTTLIERHRVNSSSFPVDLTANPGADNGIFLCLWVQSTSESGRDSLSSIQFDLFTQ